MHKSANGHSRAVAKVHSNLNGIQSNLSGVMSTASGLVFAGDNEGHFNAFDGRTGKRVWSYRTGSPIWGAAATSYMLDGRQYVLNPSGNTLVAYALPENK